MCRTQFPQPDPKKSIPALEEEILKYWQENRIFEKTLESRGKHHEFVFFDGPPFATGDPHYGHILTGTIKDAIPRYWTMKGYHVARKWGWDCHGVPVEFQVEKEHKIGGKPGIEKMGVGKFNELCRSVVMRCADNWEKTVDRMGRFVDFKDDYKTMDPEFMESVWWVFSELWKKDLIYEGEKVIAYSPKLGSPLSNFEANLNYKNISDPAVTVKFELLENEKKSPQPPSRRGEGKTFLLAWTTTPWTLPSNLALCVNPKIEYVKIPCPVYWDREGKETFLKGFWKTPGHFVANIPTEKTETFIVSEKYALAHPQSFGGKTSSVMKSEMSSFEKISGEKLRGADYKPLFPFFENHEKAFQVLGDGFVSADDGTGIVHQAPNFGEDDARVCFENKIKPLDPQPIDESGFFDATIPELSGKYFRDDLEVPESKNENANNWVLENLGDKIFKKESVTHSYPHCWRTDCALMYRGIQTWFVDVQKIKKTMLEKNQEINWIPEHLKNGRFGKMLADAPDWAISRNRFWGTPIPAWRCEKCGEIHVISSRAELENLTGKEVPDLHKHFVDELVFGCEKCDGKMRRIPEVLDCWFESGAMPYASKHFPFGENFIERNGEKFEIRVGTAAEFKKVWKWKTASKNGKNALEKYLKSPAETLFLCFLGNQPVGHLFVKNIGEKKVDFHTLEFDENFRGIGLGTEIFKFAEQHFCEKNFEIGTIGAYFDEEKNQKRYEKWGFQKTEKEEFCEIAKKKCFIFEKKLIRKNQEKKIQTFKSADFIAEGLDQTRGWFYTLHVLGCALFGKNIFKNVITNGIVLAEDGQKMSKSKKNYPDPKLVFDQYGADAVRFYLLSSPVVRGENFKFSERGVAEVLKQVILPLRSTYQFFSTYANIDGWCPTKFVFVRHGEGEHNAQRVYSGAVENQHHLTPKGKKEAIETAKKVGKCDVLIASPFVRTRETAEILKKETKFSGEILTDDRVREVSFGELEGKSLITSPERIANKTTEQPAEVQKRVVEFFEEMVQKYPGKKIGVVTHGAPIRGLDAHLNGIETLEEFLFLPMAQTAEAKYRFPLPSTKNELDRWILSELQAILQKYRKNFDAYDLEGALREIPRFIDKLNNWYLRRSRQRFWASGVSADKQSAYETLHFVLLNFAKILAPVCPFFAEQLFQNLGAESSVHLEFFPRSQEKFIDKKLEKKIEISREVVRLAAGVRARQKIKLRQPLAKLQFCTTEKIDLDLEVIAAEANVKEVEILSEKKLEKIAKKIVRVNARMVGKKFGKKVQELILLGKNGEFETLPNGTISIAGEILEPGEFELGFESAAGVEAEGSAVAIVVLDTEINEFLRIEGIAREVIRAIQDLRKSNNFNLSDRIVVEFSTHSELLRKVFAEFSHKISDEVLALRIFEGKFDDGDSVEIESEKVSFKLRTNGNSMEA